MSDPQLNLFTDHQTADQGRVPAGLEQPPPDFVARIRSELEATLHTVRQAAALPWPDLTRATLAELRFHSIARWLPEEEAATLCQAFEVEMARLYEQEDKRPSTG